MAIFIVGVSPLFVASALFGGSASPDQRKSLVRNFATACAAASIATAPFPSIAAPISINDAIVEVSETSYPIIKALTPGTFGPFSEKFGKLLLDINPDKLGRSIGLGIDVFLSAPPEKVDTFSSQVKDAFAELSPSSCTLVPLPPASLAAKFGAVASDKVDGEKLKAFGDKYGAALGALAKEGDQICLPPVETLDRLALAQADLARSFGAEESQRFGAYTTPMLKSALPIGKILPLVGDAKKLTPTATPKELAAFQAAGKRIEAASTAEAQAAKLAALKARSAAVEAARLAGKPPPAAPTVASPTANPALKEELAAAREAAAKEAAAKKEAQAAEAAARKQAFKEAEEARIAELKAKSAALKAAKEVQ